MNVITQGYGAGQKIITQGFSSGNAAPLPPLPPYRRLSSTPRRLSTVTADPHRKTSPRLHRDLGTPLMPSSSLYSAVRGRVASWEYPVLDENGDPVDLTGFSFEYALKRNASDSDSAAVMILLSLSGNIRVTDPQSGVVRVEIREGDWSRLTGAGPWSLQYELLGVSPSDRRYAVAKGVLNVTGDVARP